ncbi:alpha,alpha-trehalase TreF [Sphingomonas sp. NCPPB 2930]
MPRPSFSDPAPSARPDPSARPADGPPSADAERRQTAAAQAPAHDTLSPADRYEELFLAVQTARIFPDSKVFVDCAPRHAPADILRDYRAQQAQPGFDLRAFVDAHFAVQPATDSHYVSVAGQALVDHIDALWPVLTRQPAAHPPRSSLLRLPHPYVVPGGRFAELYYWDSYFTMLGMADSGQAALVHAMTDNFAYLIDTYGFVPNGTRSYYLSRSQPPVFALMVELCEACGGPAATGYLPQLRKEYGWWMAGAGSIAPGEAGQHVVRLQDGTLLNRYWDARETPREESYAEDVETAAQQAGRRSAPAVYRDLRAAAESGWDFSSRWLCDPQDVVKPSLRLCEIRTTAILPVDLNAFLYRLETAIARLARATGDAATATQFDQRAGARRAAVQRLMWNAEEGAFFDYDWEHQRLRHALSAATVVPLFTGLATQAQADALARTLAARLLAPGGLATSETESHEQWDRPNGWAPLQWMAIRGLADYGHTALADTIAHRWLDSVAAVYAREGKLVEKYTMRDAGDGTAAAGGDGGEYPLQDGFGWTNGVTRRLLHGFPAHPAGGARHRPDA